MTDEIRWRALEASIPLDDLPTFHRAFLKARGVIDPEDMMLRRVQQSVERELNKLLQMGLARRDGEEIIVQRATLEGGELEQWLQKA